MARKLKITFRIHYDTQWGEQLYILGSIPELGNNDQKLSLPMHWEGEGYWRLAIEVEPKTSFTYNYSLNNKSKILISEFGQRLFNPLPYKKTILVKDTWLPLANEHHPFFSSAFLKTVFKRENPIKNSTTRKYNVRLNIRAPRIPKHLQLCISGSSEALGAWNPEKPLLLSDVSFPNWTCSFYSEDERVEYKYGLFDPEKNIIIQWEESDNRVFHIAHNYDVTQQNDEVLRIYNEWRGAGVAIPVFSIRTEKSMGCGEFEDLHLLTDWSCENKLKLIQILPINDTISTYTWRDSYPYNAISVNALHPIYLHIPKLFKKVNEKLQTEIERTVEDLNKIDHVDFERVLIAKLAFARKAFQEDKQSFKKEKAYKNFSNKNSSWLIPYAMYCYLRDKFSTSNFREWGKYAKYKPIFFAKEQKDNKEFSREVDFYCFLQYHLDKQLSGAVEYARSNGVIVKGDIPIGINRNGVEAWQEPHLFNFNQQAGAPPDDFAINGQNWGFPTYNWKVMEARNYKWWEERFKKMADYFDAYRIDHVLGFFRIWEIPLKYSKGLMGHFNPALPVNEDELRSYGIDFDYDRFCKPYISKAHLFHLFGDIAEHIINTFFEETEKGIHFKSIFDTEEKVVSYMDGLPDNNPMKRCKDEICFFHYQVLLVPDDIPGFYHPRIALHFSHSFQQLSDQQKDALNSLYVSFYYHRHDDFWEYEGRKKLAKLIEATDMLVCGEDLGMIPNCVEGVMNDLKILSLEVQRMPKDENANFGDPFQYPYLSVCTPATHDMSTIRGWWEEDEDVSQQYYNDVLRKRGEAPKKCEPWLNEILIENQLNARSMFTILSMQDWLNGNEETLNPCSPEDERINIPKNPKHYWKYRMHISLEDLLKNHKINNYIKELITKTERD